MELLAAAACGGQMRSGQWQAEPAARGLVVRMLAVRGPDCESSTHQAQTGTQWHVVKQQGREAKV